LRREYGITVADWDALDAAEWVWLVLGLSDGSRLRATVAAEGAPSATVPSMRPRPVDTDPDRFLAGLRRHQGRVEIIRRGDASC
jgi:hypothetical protein